MIPPQGKYNFCCTALFFSDFEHARMTRALGLDIFSGHRQSLSQSILASNNFPFQEMVMTGSMHFLDNDPELVQMTSGQDHDTPQSTSNFYVK